VGVELPARALLVDVAEVEQAGGPGGGDHASDAPTSRFTVGAVSDRPHLRGSRGGRTFDLTEAGTVGARLVPRQDVESSQADERDDGEADTEHRDPRS
jgi:hypothetical protein